METMTLNRLTGVNAVLAVVLGLAFALAGPGLLPLYGASQIPAPIASDANAISFWAGMAFTRMFGVALLGFGVLLWFVRYISDRMIQRSVSGALFIVVGFMALIALIQQITIWSTAVGWVTVGVLILFTLGYGYCFLFTKTKTIH
jgi:hypothetical protein